MSSEYSSVITFDIKPYEPSTNLDSLAEQVFKSVQFEGLSWNPNYRISLIAFGLKKLVVMCTINDKIVIIDKIIEEILSIKESDNSEPVQSVDIVSFNRI